VRNIDIKSILTASDMLTSLLLLALILIARRMMIQQVWGKTEVLSKDQRRWIIRIKNISIITVILGMTLIWAPQLHTLALSIAAFAAAVVVATKEMILCVMGAIMRMTSQSFKVGDWISIDGMTGEVIDLDAFSFSLQEVDSKGKTYTFTGRTIIIPNSKLFTANVENANFFKTYLFEDIRIVVQHNDIGPVAASTALNAIAEKHFTPYRTDAQSFNRKIRRRAAIGIGQAEPVYDLVTTDTGHYVFMCRLFLPTGVAAKTRSAITREFLEYIYRQRLDVNGKKSVAPQTMPDMAD